MKSIILLVLFFISSITIFSDDLWEELPVPKAGISNTCAVINSKGHIFISNNGIMKTTDFGINWNNVYSYAPYLNYNGALIDSKDNIMFWSNYYFHLSTDEGKTWEMLELLIDDAPTIVNKTMFCSKDTFYLYIEYYGLYKLKEDFSEWIKISEPIGDDEFKIKSYEIFDNRIVVISKNGEIFSSTDYGATWEVIPCDTLIAPVSKFLSPDGIIYAPDNNFLYMSYDFGKTYKKISNENKIFYFYDFIFFDNNGNVYYQDRKSSSIWVSKDKGETWKLLFECKYCYWVSIKITSNKQYYFLQDGVNYWISNDNGKTLYARNLGNSLSFVDCIQPLTKNEYILVCNNGIFYTNDDGVSYENKEPLSLMSDSRMTSSTFNKVSDNELFGQLCVGDYKAII